MNILLTGGAGYIGSHTAIELVAGGHSVVIIDNLSNSSAEAIHRVEQLTQTSIPFYEADVRNEAALERIFTEHAIDAVIHFAGLKAVGESVAKPLTYYENNLTSSLTLLQSMQQHGVKKLIFSSSATVYGDPETLPFTEESRIGVGVTNPYGHTKCMIEQIIRDVCAADETFEATILRYFNPIGAHESGMIGEDPEGIPNNLVPFIAQVAVGKRDHVGVFGDDYNTPDGTGKRDYIHVVDLARGHVAALEHMKPGAATYNLSRGKSVSVLEMVEAFSSAVGRKLPYKIMPRRAGDIPDSYADSSKAERELGWVAQYDIARCCEDAWRWQSQNPNGYGQ